jgi:hypothetical protein
VPFWAPPSDRVTQLLPAKPQHARDTAFGGARGAALFLGQRFTGGSQSSLLSVFALVNTSSLRGVTLGGDKPLLCEAAVDRGVTGAACEPSAPQPAGGAGLATGVADVTYGVSGWTVAAGQGGNRGGLCEAGALHWGQGAMPFRAALGAKGDARQSIRSLRACP